VKIACEKRIEWMTSAEGQSWLEAQKPLPPKVDETSPERRAYWAAVAAQANKTD
jgi:ABC-type Fe3+ transport system substrate-binding protein